MTKKTLTTFKLVMMSVIAIDSLKNLPTNAQYGSHLILFYCIGTLAFFIPSALVAAELATTWPATGGIYIWVREAFGKKMAFMTVWVQWLIAISWYPTILSFIAATIAYFFSTHLAVNKIFIFATILILFWSAVFLISLGLRISALINTLCALVGVILPMLFFIILGSIWIYNGHASQIHFLPTFKHRDFLDMDSMRLFITLLYSLMGIEVIAAHAGDVDNPQKNYPRVLLISASIILITVIPSSLAIAMVVPLDKISLTTGVIEAFTVFLQTFHVAGLRIFLILAVSLGSFGIFLTWLLTSARYLLLAAIDGALPKVFSKTNQTGMPINLLVLQGGIFTVLATAFVFMPSVNTAFWFLSAAAAQFALIFYLILFVTALRLRYKHKNISRPFRVGKHPMVIAIVCGIGMATCLAAFCFGFIPPPGMNQHVLPYDCVLTGLIIIACSLGYLIYALHPVTYPVIATLKFRGKQHVVIPKTLT